MIPKSQQSPAWTLQFIRITMITTREWTTCPLIDPSSMRTWMLILKVINLQLVLCLLILC
jgi:hypothetical protein